MRFRDFKEGEWHTFWGMLSAAVADVPDVVKGITDLGSKCSALIGTVDAGIELWQIVSAHNKFHDAVKRKIYQHVPEALSDSVNVIAKAIFKYLSRLKNSDKNIAYYYQNTKDKDFAEELFKVCVRVIPANTVPESELRFFLGEVAKIILDPENAVLLTEDEEILKGLLTSVRNLNGSLAQVQDAQHALKGELRRFLEDYRDLAVEVYELTDEVGWIKRKVDQLGEDVDELKEDVADLKRASSSSETKQPDNQEYLDLYGAPLFLDSDNLNISLKNLYVSPKVQGSQANIEYVIREWFGNRYAPPCLLLYGAAGIGKTSLVAKLIADAEEKRKADPNAVEVLAVMLRKHTDIMEKAKTGEQILEELFGAQNVHADKLLILDGLDEVCVLKHGFDGAAFLRLLSDVANGYHIIVTSRGSVSSEDESCYFQHPFGLNGLRTEQLCWTKTEVAQWCKNFEENETDQEIKDWCSDFPDKYNKFAEDDQRREIFCVPFILYLCCKDRVDPNHYDKVGEIYDKIFRSVLLRDYIRRQGHKGGFREQELKSNLIAWQYTKELAYQMLFIGELELIDDDKSNDRRAIGFRNAQNRTLKLMKTEYPELNRDDLNTTKLLAVFHFAKHGTHDGITFAHKTVCEYFTALKLYEDYFSKFTTLYFEKKDPDKAAEEVLQSFLEAFRYRAIPPEIFQYLKEMRRPSFTGTEADTADYSNLNEKQLFNVNRFFEAFQTGIRKGYLARIHMKSAVEEYLIRPTLYFNIDKQFSSAVRNLTWYLTSLGYRNFEIKDGKQTSDSSSAVTAVLGSLSCAGDVCCLEWIFGQAAFSWTDLGRAILQGAYLKRAYFVGSNLRGANLIDAHLRRARLFEANLRFANFQRAYLKGAKLKQASLYKAYLRLANLKWANLQWANLQFANLQGANLEGANLLGANLQEAFLVGTNLRKARLKMANLQFARYCTHPSMATVFPDGFNPKEHGMIEVDIDGTPV